MSEEEELLGELICSRLLSLDGGVDLCEGATRATTRTSSIHGTPAAADAAAAAAAAEAAEAIEEEGGSGDRTPCAAAAAAACAPKRQCLQKALQQLQ